MTVARYFMASVAVELRLDRTVDRSEPVHVLWAHATHDLGVNTLNLACHRANLAGPNRAMVYLDDGGDLRAGAGEEDLVGGVEFRAIDRHARG